MKNISLAQKSPPFW